MIHTTPRVSTAVRDVTVIRGLIARFVLPPSSKPRTARTISICFAGNVDQFGTGTERGPSEGVVSACVAVMSSSSAWVRFYMLTGGSELALASPAPDGMISR
jgi:hypothetical protein